MPGIRLHPAYHGYRLNDPVFTELLTLAQRRGLIVQLVVRIEDPRMQHPLMRVPDVDTKPLEDILTAQPELRVVLLGALRTVRGESIRRLIRTSQVYFEISMLEGIGGISSLLSQIPGNRVLFGSHFPFFILESAILKLKESELSVAQVDAITHQNARRLLEA
jgi:predicted TIM-barrel fold metal-dependent hydrolase